MTIDFKRIEENNSINPKILSIKITNKCNLNCPYCYENAGIELENEINFEDIKSMIDIIKPVNSIDLSGGECFTRYDLVVQAKDYAFTKINRFRIATNGTIPININDFYPVPKGKSLSFSVSIDGFEEDHDKIRGKGTFQKTLNFCRELIYYNFPVIISSVVPEYYYEKEGKKLKEFHNFIMNFGAKLHLNAAPSTLGRGINYIYDYSFKTKVRKINEQYNIMDSTCWNCYSGPPEFFQPPFNRIAVDSQGFVRAHCHYLNTPLFHYSMFTNEKYQKEMQQIYFKNKNFGFQKGILNLQI